MTTKTVLTFVAVIFIATVIFGEEPPESVALRTQSIKIRDMLDAQREILEKGQKIPDSEIQTVVKEIRILEKMSRDAPPEFDAWIEPVLNRLAQNDSVELPDYAERQMKKVNPQWDWLIEELAERELRKKSGHIRTLIYYLKIDPEVAPKKLSFIRKQRCATMLYLWHRAYYALDGDWEREKAKFLKENPMGQYMPPPDYKGGWDSGMSFEDDPDPKIRADYKAFCKKWEDFRKKEWEQDAAVATLREHRLGVQKYLINAYSLRPFATEELEELFKQYRTHERFEKEILDAVKTNVKNAPPPSEYRMWKSADFLFQAKAKFVSLKNGEVTLKKENGKTTTIDLIDLRRKDQDYVKEMIGKP